MAANILYFNSTNIKEGKGGRPQSVMFEGSDLKPNGTIVTLKPTMEATKGRVFDHVHAVEFITAETEEVVGKWVIVAPEVNVETYRMIDKQAWKFALEPNEVYAAYELKKYDRLEYSEAHFTTISGLNVGDFVKINSTGKFEKHSGGSEETSAFRVVTILDVNKPVVLQANTAAKQAATFIPDLGKMVKLEVLR